MSNFITLLIAASIADSIGFLLIELIQKAFSRTMNMRASYLLYKIILLFLTVPCLVLIWYFLETSSEILTRMFGNDFSVTIIDGAQRFANILFGSYWNIGFLITLIIWLIGFAASCFKTVKQKKLLKAILNISEPNKDIKIQAAAVQLMKELGLKKNVPVYWNELIPTPFITDYFHPKIFLPKVKVSEKQMELILKHELLHYKRGDLLIIKVSAFIKSFHWFNPLVHIFVDRIDECCEMACDELILESGEENIKNLYGSSFAILLRNSKSLNPPAQTAKFCSTSTLERRIKNMKKPIIKTKTSIAMVLSAVIVALCPLTTYAAVNTTLALEEKITGRVERDNSSVTAYNTSNYTESTEILEQDNSGETVTFNFNSKGANFIDETIHINRRILTSAMSLKPGDRVQIILAGENSTDSFRAGIVNADNHYSYVNSDKGAIVYTFDITEKNDYKVLIIGNTKSSVHITGSVTIHYK